MTTKQNYKDSIPTLLLVLFCTLSGYFYVSTGSDTVEANKSARGFIVFASLLLTLFMYLVYSRRGKISKLPFIIIILSLYGTLSSIIHGRPLEPISYLVRLISFAILIQISYEQSIKNSARWQNLISTYLTLSLTIYILEIVYDQLTSRVLYLNGAFRHAGSIGSAIGFATTLAIIALGHLSLWLKNRSTLYLSLSVAGLIAIFCTATRSIAVLSILFFWAAFLIRYRSGKRLLILLAFPALLVLAVSLLPSDTGISERIISTTQSNELDNSSEFRILILKTYVNNISLPDLLFGLGLGSFPTWFEAKTGVANVAPHFEWLWVCAELGAITLTIYLLTIIKLITSLFMKEKTSSHLKFLGLTVLASHQIIFQLANPMYFYQAYTTFALLMGWYLGQRKYESITNKSLNRSDKIGRHVNPTPNRV
ncbi:hypothetical protein QA447_24840 [Pseudomonas sp. abacavir_1]